MSSSILVPGLLFHFIQVSSNFTFSEMPPFTILGRNALCSILGSTWGLLWLNSPQGTDLPHMDCLLSCLLRQSLSGQRCLFCSGLYPNNVEKDMHIGGAKQTHVRSSPGLQDQVIWACGPSCSPPRHTSRSEGLAITQTGTGLWSSPTRVISLGLGQIGARGYPALPCIQVFQQTF
jgi:hypothetical protein